MNLGKTGLMKFIDGRGLSNTEPSLRPEFLSRQRQSLANLVVGVGGGTSYGISIVSIQLEGPGSPLTCGAHVVCSTPSEIRTKPSTTFNEIKLHFNQSNSSKTYMSFGTENEFLLKFYRIICMYCR